jgi:hypothetical protein
VKSRPWIIAAVLLVALGAVVWFTAWLAWPLAILCAAMAAFLWWKGRVHA